MTAVFQSNQNDRVTLERHREDIFLAGPLSQGCSFFPPVFIFIFRSDAGRPAPIGTPVYRTELMRQSDLSAEGIERGGGGGEGIDCFTSLAFLTSLFFFLFKLCQ